MLSAVTDLPETGDGLIWTWWPCAKVCCLHFYSPNLSGFLSSDVPSLLLILESHLQFFDEFVQLRLILYFLLSLAHQCRNLGVQLFNLLKKVRYLSF